MTTFTVFQRRPCTVVSLSDTLSASEHREAHCQGYHVIQAHATENPVIGFAWDVARAPARLPFAHVNCFRTLTLLGLGAMAAYGLAITAKAARLRFLQFDDVIQHLRYVRCVE
jgi:hypothetical protein